MSEIMKGVTLPSQSQCRNCIDIAETWGNTIPDCTNCPYEKEVKILAYHYSFFAGSTATVMHKNGEIQNISSSRLKVDIDLEEINK